MTSIMCLQKEKMHYKYPAITPAPLSFSFQRHCEQEAETRRVESTTLYGSAWSPQNNRPNGRGRYLVACSSFGMVYVWDVHLGNDDEDDGDDENEDSGYKSGRSGDDDNEGASSRKRRRQELKLDEVMPSTLGDPNSEELDNKSCLVLK
jgi:hypothetical protein